MEVEEEVGLVQVGPVVVVGEVEVVVPAHQYQVHEEGVEHSSQEGVVVGHHGQVGVEGPHWHFLKEVEVVDLPLKVVVEEVHWLVLVVDGELLWKVVVEVEQMNL